MSEDTGHEEVTEENTMPDATGDSTPADEEAGTTDVNFTMADGTAEAPASSSDGTGSDSSDSTTSRSPSDEGESPLDAGAIGESSDAPDASRSDTGSDSAEGTDEAGAKDVGVVADLAAPGRDETGDKEAKESLRGEAVDGEGATHVGTDTPAKLVSNPYNEDTGEPLFPEDTHSKEPLNFDSFKEKSDEDLGGKVDKAIELMTEIGDKLK